MTEQATREESFSFIFGALDMLANLKPNMQGKLRVISKDMFKLTFPESSYEDYVAFCQKLHKEKTDKLAERMNGLVLELLKQ